MTSAHSGSRGGRRFPLRPALAALLLAAALGGAVPQRASAQAAVGADPAALPPPDQSFASGKDVVVYPPDPASSFLRYLPDGAKIPFDRSLVLSAAPGESRAYLIQVLGAAKGGEDSQVMGYVIDKRRPRAPAAQPGTGLYRDVIRPRLSGDEGDSIFWALVGPGGVPSAFAPYGEEGLPPIAPPASGTATYSLLAYSVDPSGNRSYPSRFVYRLAEPGLPAAAPLSDSVAISADPSLPKPEVEASRGYAELRLAVPPGSVLLLDVDPDSPPESLGDFERIAPEGGYASLRVPCPYGWQEELGIYYGILAEGRASYNPTPLSVRIANPADEPPPPPAPEAPILNADPLGRAAFIAFPSYDGSILASLDGAEPAAYGAPIAIAAGTRSVKVAWYGEDDSGQRSVSRTLTIALPEAIPDVTLAGVADGASVGGDVTLKPLAKATIRYELRIDGSTPPEPGPGSPLLGDSLALTCPPGEERSVALRYRAFSGDAGGEGRILRFSLDRKPPGIPSPRERPSAYYDKPTSLSLLPGEGGTAVFAAVSADGAAADFLPVSGPLGLPGSEAGAVSYLVRAYAVDAAGNRSAEMKSLSLIVDRSSVYVAEDGSDRGDGSPDRPFKSIDLALAAAIKGGKRSVNLRGAFEMRSPFASSSDILIAGGYGPGWSKEGSTRASLRLALPAGRSAFDQRGGSLILRRLDISAAAAGPSPILSAAGATLAIEDSSIAAGAEGDLVFVYAQKSKVELSGSRMAASRAMACTVFSSDSSELAVRSSSIVGERGVRIFGAFDIDGGSLELRESLVQSGSDLGLNLLSMRSSSLLVDRSLLTAEGGSGFLRIGSFKSVAGEIKNSKVLLSWKGPGTLFEISGGGPAFRHDTIVAESSRGGLTFFDSTGGPPQLWNSIFENTGGGAELLRSDLLPGPGVLVANCLWGFDRILAGAREASELESVNAINAGSVLYSSRPSFIEAPSATFGAPIKSQAPLRASSACVGAALPLGSGYEMDFGGHPRPGPATPDPSRSGPDIGADELDG